jgi:ubiquinone/menaquinone biosynthesis C-methylase UbiE
MAGEQRAGQLNAQHRAAYDAVAEQFASVNATMPPAVLASARRFLAALAEQGSTPGVILDLGCGHGRDAAWFEAQGVRAVGADLSAGMLQQACALVRCPLVQADMRALPFAAGSFHGVWCNASLLHLPKREAPAALAEVWRLLVAGGVFYVAIQVGEGEVWEARSYDRTVARFFARYAPSEFAGLLTAAGFEILDAGENNGVPGRHWAHFLARTGQGP